MSTGAQQHGHPKGLFLLFTVEMWERFSYYGMRALFTLYMINALLLTKEQASVIYGNYVGLVYLTPLIGGYMADRFWGNRRSILVGASMMAIAQFLLFASASIYTNTSVALPLMYAGLALLIFGNGFFKPNISTMVGDLYEPTDHRKDSAFTIFYMGINLGAFIAPLICGYFGDTGDPADYKWGFLIAGIGMICGIITFQALKNKYLVTPEGHAIGVIPNASGEKAQAGAKEVKRSKKEMSLWIGGEIVFFLVLKFGARLFGFFPEFDMVESALYSLCIIMPAFIITDKALSKEEQSRLWVVYIIAFFVIFFWAAFEQAGISLTFFAEEQTKREVFGWTIPTSFFQSFNPIFIVLLAPLFAMLWGALGKKNLEPASPLKQALGLFLLSIGYLVIAFGVRGVEPGVKVSMLWLTSLYFLHTCGELCLSPIGLSMVNKLAPARFASLLMGLWFMAIATANKLAGTLSALYPEEGKAAKAILGFTVNNLFDFFMVFVVMSAVAAVILFCLTGKLKKMMHGIQ